MSFYEKSMIIMSKSLKMAFTPSASLKIPESINMQIYVIAAGHENLTSL